MKKLVLFRLLLLGVASAAICNLANGQDTATKSRPTPPPGRLLNPAPDFSAWTIIFSYPQDKKQQDKSALLPLDPNAPREVDTTKTGDIIHEVTHRISGGQYDKWQQGGSLYVRSQTSKDWGAISQAFAPGYKVTNVDYLAVPASGFRDLDWINANSYAGSVQLSKQDYLLFVTPGSADMDFSDPAKLNAQSRVAYVDAQSRLPVLVRIDGETRKYTYLPAPTAMQALPSDLAKEIKDGNDRRAKVFAAPAKEY